MEKVFVEVMEVGVEVVEELSGVFAGERVGRASEERVRPDVDEALEGVVGDEFFGVQQLHGGGAGVVAGVEPALDAAPVVGDAGAQADGGFHDVERDGAAEIGGHCLVEIVPHHRCFGERKEVREREREGEGETEKSEERRGC